MNRLLAFVLITSLSLNLQAQSKTASSAQDRAATLKKGMNLAVWLESTYFFFNTNTFPDVNRYTEADIRNLHELCFQTVRLPVFFEPFAGYTAPYAFDMSNQNVVRGLDYVDSVVKWTSRYHMNLIIDNHLADDDNSNGLQSHYQITDANYQQQAAQMCAVWRQVINRYGYTDPERVFFELRNEPNTVSDANLRVVYQAMIDTIRRYDQQHTLIVGNTGYYDARSLASSTTYADNNLIYTFHIYDGNNHPGFCFQGQNSVPATDSLTRNHISFDLHGAQAADITSEVQAVHDWSVAHGVPVWLGEFGCTTLPEVYHDDTSRCNYISTFATILDQTNTPWCYWDGYGPNEYVTSYDGGANLYYFFSLFDRSDILTEAHLTPCFRSALHLGALCDVSAGIEDPTHGDAGIQLYPNPANDILYIKATAGTTIGISDLMGARILSFEYQNELAAINTASFAAGVYLVRVTYSNGSSAVRRFTRE